MSSVCPCLRMANGGSSWGRRSKDSVFLQPSAHAAQQPVLMTAAVDTCASPEPEFVIITATSDLKTKEKDQKCAPKPLRLLSYLRLPHHLTWADPRRTAPTTTPHGKELSRHVHPQLFGMTRGIWNTGTLQEHNAPRRTAGGQGSSPRACEMALDASFRQLTSVPNVPFMSCILQPRKLSIGMG